MKSIYSEIPKRLSAYRKALNKTQEQMGEQFGVGQSHYSKLESGNKILSYKSLVDFKENGGDVYFLFTDKVRLRGKLDDYLDRCTTGQGKLELLKLIIWLVNQGIRLQKMEGVQIETHTYKCMLLAGKELEEHSIWKNIRLVEDLTQDKMAQILDISVRRYQRIERLETMPDAEILYRIYVTFQYPPLVILDRQLYYLDELNGIWEQFSKTLQDKLEDYLEKGVQICQ